MKTWAMNKQHCFMLDILFLGLIRSLPLAVLCPPYTVLPGKTR